MANFQTNSYWATQSSLTDPILPQAENPRPTLLTVSIAAKKVEDWSLRLQTMADEAHDHANIRVSNHYIGPLETDLLDLRDEILSELHKGM